jgi:hypothetical protein
LNRKYELEVLHKSERKDDGCFLFGNITDALRKKTRKRAGVIREREK